MAYDVNDVLRTGIERLTTRMGGVLIGCYAAFGLLLTGATQGLFLLAIGRWIEPRIEDDLRQFLQGEAQTVIEDARQENPEAAAELESLRQQVLEAGLADALAEYFPYAITANWGAAVAGLLVAVVGILAVMVVAYNAFGRGIESPDAAALDRLGWKMANLFVASLLATLFLLLTLGLTFALSAIHPLLSVLGVLLWLLVLLVFSVAVVYVPAAIAIDGTNAFRAFGRSYRVARANLLGTVVLLVLWIALVVAVGFTAGSVLGVFPTVVATPLEELVNAAVTVTMIALIGAAYAAASASEVDAPTGDDGTGPRSGADSRHEPQSNGDDWGGSQSGVDDRERPRPGDGGRDEQQSGGDDRDEPQLGGDEPQSGGDDRDEPQFEEDDRDEPSP